VAQFGRSTDSMPWFRPRDLLDQTFEVGVILKGLDGVLEVIGGFLLLVTSPATIDRVVTSLTPRPAVRPSAGLPTCSRFSGQRSRGHQCRCAAVTY
jgi:uncharacterized membrane protein